jgi:hypothetical protein
MPDYRARMLKVLRGETPERPLFVPRLDIWYNRNHARGTLPAGYENLSLREVAQKLGVGLHAVVPDFIRSAPAEDLHHRGLGFYNNPEFPYVADFSGVSFDVEQGAEELKVVYHTRRGDLVTRCGYGPHLFASGSSIPDVLEHAVKTPEDYARLAEVFSRVRIRPAPERFAARRERIGADGVAVAFLSLACGPMHHLLRDCRKYEAFCLDLYDDPGLLAGCAEALATIYDAILASAAASTAEVVLFGANYDEVVTYPPFFAEHVAPWLNRATDAMRAAGKLLLTHTDGENQGLLPVLRDCRFDVADSICPAPMTKVTLAAYRAFFGTRATIWGGIPSNILLRACCPEAEFRAFVRQVLAECRPYDRLILSIADTTPPDAEFGRIQYLAEASAKDVY